jgi:hypothetical protein
VVNRDRSEGRGRLRVVTGLVAVYVVIAIGTVVALGALSAVEPRVATTAAWVHAVIVLVFAVVLPLRLRAVGRGSRRALIAVGIIAAVLLVVNVVEALIPGLFPLWMRVEMVAIAVVMASVILFVVWHGIAHGAGRTPA